MYFHRFGVFFCLILAAVSGLPLTDSFPTGIGSMADNGCVCHGSQSNATEVSLHGLPIQFESSQTYEIILSLESSVEQATNASHGGFRILMSEGLLEPENASLVKKLKTDGRIPWLEARCVHGILHGQRRVTIPLRSILLFMETQ